MSPNFRTFPNNTKTQEAVGAGRETKSPSPDAARIGNPRQTPDVEGEEQRGRTKTPTPNAPNRENPDETRDDEPGIEPASPETMTHDKPPPPTGLPGPLVSTLLPEQPILDVLDDFLEEPDETENPDAEENTVSDRNPETDKTQATPARSKGQKWKHQKELAQLEVVERSYQKMLKVAEEEGVSCLRCSRRNFGYRVFKCGLHGSCKKHELDHKIG